MTKEKLLQRIQRLSTQKWVFLRVLRLRRLIKWMEAMKTSI